MTGGADGISTQPSPFTFRRHESFEDGERLSPYAENTVGLIDFGDPD